MRIGVAGSSVKMLPAATAITGLDQKGEPGAGDHVTGAIACRQDQRGQCGLVRQLGQENYAEGRGDDRQGKRHVTGRES